MLAMKAVDGTYAENALKHGLAGLNIDDCRIGANGQSPTPCKGAGWAAQDEKNAQQGYRPKAYYGDQDGVDYEPHNQGRWPANTIFSHHPNCQRHGVTHVKNTSGSVRGDEPSEVAKNAYGKFNGRKPFSRFGGEDGYEVVEQWECVAGCPVRMLAEQSGESTSSGGGGLKVTGINTYGDYNGHHYQGNVGLGDKGTAARFFYTAKVSSYERDAGLPDGMENDHPTLKPLSICRYLATLLLPPPQDKPRRILIPFAGTGSEATGALLAGWDEVVMVEMDEKSTEIARYRIDHWLEMAQQAGTTDVDELLAHSKGVDKAKEARRKKIEAEQMTLF